MNGEQIRTLQDNYIQLQHSFRDLQLKYLEVVEGKVLDASTGSRTSRFRDKLEALTTNGVLPLLPQSTEQYEAPLDDEYANSDMASLIFASSVTSRAATFESPTSAGFNSSGFTNMEQSTAQATEQVNKTQDASASTLDFIDQSTIGKSFPAIQQLECSVEDKLIEAELFDPHLWSIHELFTKNFEADADLRAIASISYFKDLLHQTLPPRSGMPTYTV